MNDYIYNSLKRDMNILCFGVCLPLTLGLLYIIL